MQTAPVIRSKFDTVGSYLCRVCGPFQHTACCLRLTGSGIPLTPDKTVSRPSYNGNPYIRKNGLSTKTLNIGAVDKPKFMGRPPDRTLWKAGSPESFLGCQNYFDLSLKEICFLAINTKCVCFRLNHVLDDFGGSCWIVRPSDGSHLATGRPLIQSTRTYWIVLEIIKDVLTFPSVSWILFNRGRPNSQSWQWSNTICRHISYTVNTMPPDALVT